MLNRLFGVTLWCKTLVLRKDKVTHCPLYYNSNRCMYGIVKIIELTSVYRSLWRHHVHWWHSILLTTAVHVTDRHHGVDVAWLVGNHRNFGLRLHATKSTSDIIVTLVNLPLFSDNNITNKINNSISSNMATPSSELFKTVSVDGLRSGMGKW